MLNITAAYLKDLDYHERSAYVDVKFFFNGLFQVKLYRLVGISFLVSQNYWFRVHNFTLIA